jgi:hypothetical protein
LNSCHIDEYINQIQLCINDNISLIADFSHDNSSARKKILDQLIIPQDKKINFITISIRPDIKTLIKQDSIKRNIQITENYIKWINSIYNNFIYPNDDEFKKYNFNSINHFEIENNNDYDKILNLIYQI